MRRPKRIELVRDLAPLLRQGRRRKGNVSGAFGMGSSGGGGGGGGETDPVATVALSVHEGEDRSDNVHGLDTQLDAIETTLAAKQPLDAELTALAALTTTVFGRSLLEAADAAALRALAGAAASAHVHAQADVTNLTSDLATRQPLDAMLTALAALSTVADRGLYFTGADAPALFTLTSFARTILDDADAAAVRTTIGAQASDATLTALAALSTAANKLIYATGADAFATTDLSAFARTLLDDADAATMRATLGLGALAVLATINGSNWSGQDLAVADGGTGASSAAAARTNLGLDSEAKIAPTLASGMANFGSGASEARYWKDPFGVVHLEGSLVASGGATLAFTLPAGYRPPEIQHFLVLINFDGTARWVEIQPDGDVIFSASPSVAGKLDGITFRAA